MKREIKSNDTTGVVVGSKEKRLASAQLYRRAGKYLEAARIIFDVRYLIISLIIFNYFCNFV